MKYFCVIIFVFQCTISHCSLTEVSNLTTSPVNITDSIVNSTVSVSSTTTSSPLLSSEITTQNFNNSETAKLPASDNEDLTKSNTSEKNDAAKDFEGYVTASTTTTTTKAPIILIPRKQYTSQSMIIPTLRAYQKYSPIITSTASIGKRKSNGFTFTDTATPCPICGRMICGTNGNLCPVCLYSGRSNLDEIENSTKNLHLTTSGDDPLMMNGLGLRKRRKNAWRVATLMRPGSLSTDQNQLARDLRSGRDLWSWFGMKPSDEQGSQQSGQTLDYRPLVNEPPALQVQQEDQMNQRSPSSKSPRPTFLDKGNKQPKMDICFYPESHVLLAPQPQVSKRVSNFQTILSALN